MEPFYRNEYRSHLEDYYIENEYLDMSNEKALELLLLFTLPIQEAGPMAEKLISHFGSFSKVIDADFEELIEVGGMDRDSAVLVSLVKNLSNRTKLEPEKQITALDNYKAAISLFSQFLRFRRSTVLYAAALDKSLNIIGTKEIEKGERCFSYGTADEVADYIKGEGASSAVIAYNADSDEEYPSGEKRRFVSKLKEELSKNKINLDDVIVITNDKAYAYSRDIRLAVLIN